MCGRARGPGPAWPPGWPRLPGVVSVRGAGLLLAAQLGAPAAKEIAAAALTPACSSTRSAPTPSGWPRRCWSATHEIDAALEILAGVMAAGGPAYGTPRRRGLTRCPISSTSTTSGPTATSACWSWPRATDAWAGCSRARAWPCSSRSPRPAPATPPRWRSSSLGGHPVYIQGTEVGLDTRESAEDVARTLGCYHRISAPGSSTTTCSRAWPSRSTAAVRRPGGQPALRRGPPLPGHRRRAHAARAASGRCPVRCWPTSATPTTCAARWSRRR